MPRTGRRRSLTAAAAVLAVLAAPAAAHAATYTVGANAGDGPCGGADLACGELADAAAAAAVGDVFNVTPGTYGSAHCTSGGGANPRAAAGVAINGALVFSGTTGGVSKLHTLVISTVTGSGPSVSVTGPAG